MSFYQPASKDKGIICFYDAFYKELSKTNNVFMVPLNFNWNETLNHEIPPAALRKIIEFQPDLVITFNNLFYDLTKWIDCPVLVYGVDTPIYYSNKEKLLEHAKRHKHAVPCKSSAQLLIDLYNVPKENISILPFFTAVQAEKITQTVNISFVGNNFSHCLKEKNPFNDFMATSPSTHEIKLFKECLRDIQNTPLLNIEQYKKNHSHLPTKVLENISDKIIWYFSANNRIKALSQVADLGLEVYGPTTWASDIYSEHELTLSYRQEQVFTLQENQDLYNRSLLALNINHVQAKEAFSWRVCDIMASNACLVTGRQKILEERFPKLKLPTFSSRYEVRALCKELLKNKNMREDIVMASQEMIDNNYRFKHILPIIEELVGLHLS